MRTKKLLSVFLACVLLAGSFSYANFILLSADAQQDPVDYYRYQINGKTAELLSYAEEYAEDPQNVTVPQMLNGGVVWEIPDGFFAGHTEIVSVTVPRSVKRIGKNAFDGCTSLRSVLFAGVDFDHAPRSIYADHPYSMQYLADRVNHEWEQYKDLLYHQEMQIDENAFANCPTLTLWDIDHAPLGPWKIEVAAGNAALLGADRRFIYNALPMPEIVDLANEQPAPPEKPQTATENEWTYYLSPRGAVITGYAGEATDVTVPLTLGGSTVYRIEKTTFENNTTIKKLSFPQQLKEIEDGSFYTCTALESFDYNNYSYSIPTSIYIYYGSFLTNGAKLVAAAPAGKMEGYYPTEFNKLPFSIREIAPYAFANHQAMTSVSIPRSVMVIGENAFLNCSSLSWITFGQDAREYDMEKNPAEYTYYFQYNYTYNYAARYQHDTMQIGKNAFSGTSLKQVLFTNPAGAWTLQFDEGNKEILSLYDAAAAGKVNVQAEFADSLEPAVFTEGDWTFETFKDGVQISAYAGKDANIVIPDALNGLPVLSLADRLFENREDVTHITLPKDLQNIGENVFVGCSNLQELHIDENNRFFTTNAANSLLSKNGSTLYCMPLGKLLLEYPTWQERLAVRRQLQLQLVNSGVNLIKSGAVTGNKNFTMFGMSYSLYADGEPGLIEKNAFVNCGSLIHIYFPDLPVWTLPTIDYGNDDLTRAPVYLTDYRPGYVMDEAEITAADARLALRASVGINDFDYPGLERANYACSVDFQGFSAACARLILRASVSLEDPNEWLKSAKISLGYKRPDSTTATPFGK
ncbi:MAG: leucine-rich repeat protein [Clostridia bacterium]|nr:leucine-rich repeat protein [Clostridia bacterium]